MKKFFMGPRAPFHCASQVLESLKLIRLKFLKASAKANGFALLAREPATELLAIFISV